jgi:hypothetical protein
LLLRVLKDMSCGMSRIKSHDNCDRRVELLQKYARTHFPAVKYMEYAVTVETYTMSKANNLVMNVDGCIGSLFLDLLSSCAMFTEQEIVEIIEIGYLNGLFILARSIGLIGCDSFLISLHECVWFVCVRLCKLSMCCKFLSFNCQAMSTQPGAHYCKFLILLLACSHTFDQKRLKEPLYRHPWEDVLYTRYG